VSTAKPKGTFEPGVISGAEYEQLIQTCKDGNYALPAVNVVGTNSINAVLEAAAANKSDVIIQLSGGGAEFYAGKGVADTATRRLAGAVSAARHVHLMAKAYGICVVLHTDHANRKLLPWIDDLITAGEAEYAATGRPLYSSHMLDLSEESLADNLDECASTLKRLNAIDMSLEIELGVTGGEEDGVGSDVEGDDFENSRLFTQPSEVLEAYNRLTPLGHFTIAAAFGNVHGVYKPGNVKLRPEILKLSQEALIADQSTGPKPLSFVFHGGSGSEPAKIKEAIDYGVVKMNIDTDTQFAFAEGVGKYVDENTAAFHFQLDPETGAPLKKKYDPRAWLRAGETSIINRLEEAFDVLGSKGKSQSSAM
jgi:fructose-bisphosphate aldolase, class II